MAEFPQVGGLDVPVEVPVELTQHQLLILSVLRSAKKEVGYGYLKEHTGLQSGTLSNAIMDETKQGNRNEHSLVSRKLVSVAQHEPQEGETVAPYLFKLIKV